MPGDAPHFPPPGRKDAYRAPAPAPAPAKVVVKRAEPPPSSEPSPRVALTKDEIRALVVIEAAKHPRWRRSARRAPLLVLVTIVGHFLGTSWWSLGLSTALYVAALFWIARPLFRRDELASP